MRRCRAIIYFIQEPLSGSIKIGFTDSRDVNSRLKQLQTSHPVKLVVLATMNGDVDGEYALHRVFENYRLEGEWFSPVKPLLDFIQTIGTDDDTTVLCNAVEKWRKSKISKAWRDAEEQSILRQAVGKR